jgi:glycosyltransferase involved in cell wall biosynthesis
MSRGEDLEGILEVVKAPKLLCVVSAIDLDFRYGCTPAWWQIWKGLYEAGVDLILTPYRGQPLASPWWRTEENPCYREGEIFAATQRLMARVRRDTHVRRAEENPEQSFSERASRELIWRYVTPRWRRHLIRVLERERDIDAVVVFTVPMSHLRGIPTELRERFGVPIVYYDADVPMSLPEYGGMDTGFNIYHGADPAEYDLVLSNSEGGLGRLRELGARRAEALFWGADPELFAPMAVEKEHDVSFYAYGDKFRREWMRELIGEPSRQLADVDFVLGGTDFQGDVGRARELGYFPVNLLSRLISASKINLNVARKPHASVYASSTSRLFELAAAGAAIVTNPYLGIERWFEPGRELLVVSKADEAVDAYRSLLEDPGAAAELGRNARERVLAEHTFADRAERLLELVGVRSPRVTAAT